MMRIFKKVLCSLLIGLPPMLWAQTGGAAGPDSWKLLPQAQVDGSGVFLDQISGGFGDKRRVSPMSAWLALLAWARRILFHETRWQAWRKVAWRGW